MFIATLAIVFISFLALVRWGTSELFGNTIGTIITIAVAGLIYLALTLYTDRQEKLLYKELNDLRPEERNDILEEAKEKGIID